MASRRAWLRCWRGQLVNLLTLAAEIGGIAIVLQLLSGLSYRVLLVLAVLAVALVLWLMPFEWIERVFGYMGLTLLVFAVAGDQAEAGLGRGRRRVRAIDRKRQRLGLWLLRRRSDRRGDDPLRGLLLLLRLLEERWRPKDLGINRANAFIGYTLGGFLSFALMISAGALLLPQGISAELLGTVALVAQAPLGEIGLILALVGILFAVSGAAIDFWLRRRLQRRPVLRGSSCSCSAS